MLPPRYLCGERGMTDEKVHNYAFRKALGYVKSKKGRLESDRLKALFEDATNQRIAMMPPFLPSYYPLETFVTLLKLIEEHFGEENRLMQRRESKRSYEIGYYLYSGQEEETSPYHHLNPHKKIDEVVNEFYANLRTPSGLLKNCNITVEKEGNVIRVTWRDLSVDPIFLEYLEGLHAGMIKASTSDASMSTKKLDGAIEFDIEILG